MSHGVSCLTNVVLTTTSTSYHINKVETGARHGSFYCKMASGFEIKKKILLSDMDMYYIWVCRKFDDGWFALRADPMTPFRDQTRSKLWLYIVKHYFEHILFNIAF